MNDFEITCSCSECEDNFDVNDMYFLCEKCKEKLEENEGFIKELMNTMYSTKNIECILDGSNEVGFDSEKEKKIFMQGVRMGYLQTAFDFAYSLGNKFLPMYEAIMERAKKIEIKVNYDVNQEIKAKEYERKQLKNE